MLNLYRSLTRRGKALVWGAGIALAVLIFSFGSNSAGVVAGAQIMAAWGTLALAALAYMQVNEMRESRLAQERPQVIVDADYSRRDAVDIVVRNVGRGAAKNITFKFSSPMISVFSEEERSRTPVSEFPFFKDGLEYMAPGAEFRVMWDGSERLIDLLEARGLQDGIRITSYYESMSGEPHCSPIRVNPVQMGMVAEEGKGMNELVKVVEELRKDFRKAQQRPGGAIKVITQTREEWNRERAEQMRKNEEWFRRIRGDQGSE